MGKIIELIKLGILSIVLGGLVLWVIGYTLVKMHAGADCYKQGFTDSRVSYNFDRYCVSGDRVVLQEKE